MPGVAIEITDAWRWLRFSPFSMVSLCEWIEEIDYKPFTIFAKKWIEAGVVLPAWSLAATRAVDASIHVLQRELDELAMRYVSLSNNCNNLEKFMTIKVGLYFLWAGLVLLAVSGTGAVVLCHSV
jgi:hypothetical protein